MPNNPFRHKAGFVKVAGSLLKARRRDIISSVRVSNRAFATASQEVGSPNGGPAPTFGGSTSTGGGSVTSGDGGGFFGGGEGGYLLP
jgi:hypothetical protein